LDSTAVRPAFAPSPSVNADSTGVKLADGVSVSGTPFTSGFTGSDVIQSFSNVTFNYSQCYSGTPTIRVVVQPQTVTPVFHPFFLLLPQDIRPSFCTPLPWSMCIFGSFSAGLAKWQIQTLCVALWHLFHRLQFHSSSRRSTSCHDSSLPDFRERDRLPAISN